MTPSPRRTAPVPLLRASCRAAASEQLVPDLIEVPVPVGGRVLVASDLHLSANADATSERVAAELARTVQAWAGPGAVVLAGDAFELLGSGGNDPSGALRAHPRLVGALAAFADGPDRRVVVLPGNHDGALAWHPAAVRALQTQLHAQVAIAADLVIATGSGERRVRVEHGHQLDPSNAFDDPRNPGETPLGHHVVREVLPVTRERGAEWLDGLELLVDSGDAAAFVGSRLTYRRLARRALTLVVPFLLSGVLAIASLLASGSAADDLATAALVTLIVAAALVVAVGVGGLWWLWAVGRPLSTLRTAALTGTAGTQNDAPRRRAGRLVGDGLAGYITGHTHEPELTDLGGGFYANSGCGGEVVERRRGWLGLPDAFSIGRRISWVELEAGADLRVELHCGRQSLPTTTAIERVVHSTALGRHRHAGGRGELAARGQLAAGITHRRPATQPGPTGRRRAARRGRDHRPPLRDHPTGVRPAGPGHRRPAARRAPDRGRDRRASRASRCCSSLEGCVAGSDTPGPRRSPCSSSRPSCTC